MIIIIAISGPIRNIQIVSSDYIYIVSDISYFENVIQVLKKYPQWDLTNY